MWHYNVNGQAHGPVEESVFLQWISEGRINAQTLVWREGQADWLPAGQTSLWQNFQAPVSSAPVRSNPYAAPRSFVRPEYQKLKVTPLTWVQILFGFTGRIPRWQFWVGHLIAMVPLIGMVMLAPSDESRDVKVSGLEMGIILFAFFLFAWMNLALAIKRWHDRGKSGFMILIGLIPIIGGIWAFIETGCLRGTVGANEYGADPT